MTGQNVKWAGLKQTGMRSDDGDNGRGCWSGSRVEAGLRDRRGLAKKRWGQGMALTSDTRERW